MSTNNEYSFWWLVKNGKTPLNTLNSNQAQAYMLLENKVAMYGAKSLNRDGWGWSSDVAKPYGGINEGESLKEPFMVSSLTQAGSDYQLQPSAFKSTGNPNLYSATNKLGNTSYFFVIPDIPAPPPKVKPFMPPVGKTLKAPKSGVNTTYSGPTKPSKSAIPVIKEIPSQYDLLFNSLSYMSVGEAEIERLSMDLIFAGDDLLTDFDYRSIDYLPDFEIETTNKYGEYTDALNVFQNNQFSNNDKVLLELSYSNIKDPISLDTVIQDLIQELKDNLENKKFAQTQKYFGVNTKTGFKTGYSKGEYIDFRYPLSEKYDKYTITIDFNRI